MNTWKHFGMVDSQHTPKFCWTVARMSSHAESESMETAGGGGCALRNVAKSKIFRCSSKMYFQIQLVHAHRTNLRLSIKARRIISLSAHDAVSCMQQRRAKACPQIQARSHAPRKRCSHLPVPRLKDMKIDNLAGDAGVADKERQTVVRSL